MPTPYHTHMSALYYQQKVEIATALMLMIELQKGNCSGYDAILINQ